MTTSFIGGHFLMICYNMIMKKIWINKANSFKEASEFDSAYYAKMSKAERIWTMQLLREIYSKLRTPKIENGKGLRKVIKIIQQK